MSGRSTDPWKWTVAIETLVLAALLALLLRSGSLTEGASAPAPPPGDGESVAAAVAAHAGQEAPAPPLEVVPRREVVKPPRARVAFVAFGRVVDEQGNPLDGVAVFARSTGGDVPISRAAQVTAGRYAVAGLAAGDWQLAAQGQGYRRRVETVTLSAAEPLAHCDLVLQRAVVLQVRVQTPEGEPLEEVARRAEAGGAIDFRTEPHAAAFLDPPPAALPMSDTRSTHGVGVGEFHSRWFYKKEAGEPPDCIGRLELDVDLPVHVALLLRHLTLTSQLVGPGASEVVFSLPLDALHEQLGSIRLRVVDGGTGAPIEGARVDVSDRQGGFTSGRAPEGSVIVRPGIPPGRWSVAIFKKDYEHVTEVVRLAPRQDLDLGDVALHAVRPLRGVVLDGDGRPVHATLRWDALDRRRFPQPLRNNQQADTNAEGEFTLQVGRGRYAVHALAGTTAAAHVIVEVGAEPPAPLELRLQATHPVRLVTDFGRHEFYVVSIRTKDGVPVYGEELRSGSPGPILLPRGDYVVDIHRDVTPVRSYELRVGDGEAVLRVP